MSDPTVDKIMSGLAGQVRHTLEEGLRDVASDWRELISVPVVRQGGRVIRSSPGQPPRKDTGKLYDSVRSAVESLEGDKIRGTVSTDTPYDQFLKHGTPRMAPRPNDGPIEAKWEPILVNRLALSVRQLPP